MNGSKVILAAATAFAALCATGVGLSASAHANRLEQGPFDNRMNDQLAQRLLNFHNRERQALGLPRLKWNRALEAEARQWAQELARRGELEHADRATRNNAGENLWMGSAGHWDVVAGIDMMIDEKEMYRHAAFPKISTTGNWADVAHYTQIVWRDTKEVGCSVVNDHGWDVLVCRYWPAGNVWGQKAY